MRRFRFTIGGLLGLVVIVAVAVAALREATDVWDAGAFTATQAVLLAAVLLAVHRRDRGRAYWLGFALFGWAYLVASLVPPVESRLLTTRGLASLDSLLPGRSLTFSVAFSPDGRALAIPGKDGRVRLWNAATGRLLSGPNGTSENFVKIGHSLIALALAFTGGCLSRWLYRRGRGPEERPAEATAGPTATASAAREGG